jgi:hypothetical protein
MQQGHHVAQQLPGIDALIARIRRRKVLTDVAQGSGTQQGIAYGMQQHIGIGMPIQTFSIRHVHPAYDARAPYHQGMHIKTVSYTHRFILNWPFMVCYLIKH